MTSIMASTPFFLFFLLASCRGIYAHEPIERNNKFIQFFMLPFSLLHPRNSIIKLIYIVPRGSYLFLLYACWCINELFQFAAVVYFFAASQLLIYICDTVCPELDDSLQSSQSQTVSSGLWFRDFSLFPIINYWFNQLQKCERSRFLLKGKE